MASYSQPKGIVSSLMSGFKHCLAPKTFSVQHKPTWNCPSVPLGPLLHSSSCCSDKFLFLPSFIHPRQAPSNTLPESGHTVSVLVDLCDYGHSVLGNLCDYGPVEPLGHVARHAAHCRAGLTALLGGTHALPRICLALLQYMS